MKKSTQVIISKNEKTDFGFPVILQHTFPTKKLAMIFVSQFQEGMNTDNLFIVKVY